MTTRRLGAVDGAAPADLLPLEQFVRFRDLIEEQCGLHFDESQRASLSASLRARMQQLGARPRSTSTTIACGSGPPTMSSAKLINLVTITETCFFRDQLAVSACSAPHPAGAAGRARRQPARRLRIWSAGCSSGEEAYSIALTLWEMGLYRTLPDWTFDIVGTDVNTEVLDAAQAGRVFGARAAQRRRRPTAPLLPARRSRFPPERRHQAPRPLRVRQPDADAAAAALDRRYDIVFCKNVAIYFRSESEAAAWSAVSTRALNDGGYLLLGHSESLWQTARGIHAGRARRRLLLSQALARCPAESARSRPAARHETRAAPGQSRRLRDRPPSAWRPPIRSPRRSHVAWEAAGHDDRCLSAFRADEWTEAETSLGALIQSSPTLRAGVPAARRRLRASWPIPGGREQAERVLRLNDLEAARPPAPGHDCGPPRAA